jgi:hypothetical protein
LPPQGGAARPSSFGSLKLYCVLPSVASVIAGAGVVEPRLNPGCSVKFGAAMPVMAPTTCSSWMTAAADGSNCWTSIVGVIERSGCNEASRSKCTSKPTGEFEANSMMRDASGDAGFNVGVSLQTDFTVAVDVGQGVPPALIDDPKLFRMAIRGLENVTLALYRPAGTLRLPRSTGSACRCPISMSGWLVRSATGGPVVSTLVRLALVIWIWKLSTLRLAGWLSCMLTVIGTSLGVGMIGVGTIGVGTIGGDTIEDTDVLPPEPPPHEAKKRATNTAKESFANLCICPSPQPLLLELVPQLVNNQGDCNFEFWTYAPPLGCFFDRRLAGVR